MALREPVLDSDVTSIKIAKISNSLLGKIKDSPSLSKSFSNIIGSENDFFLQLKSENFKFPLLSILQFTNEILESRNLAPLKPEYSTPTPQKSFRNYSNIADDDYFKLIEESEMLAKTISSQKVKISQICEKVKESINNGRSLTSSLSRPQSSLVKSYSSSPRPFHSVIIEEEKDEDRH